MNSPQTLPSPLLAPARAEFEEALTDCLAADIRHFAATVNKPLYALANLAQCGAEPMAALADKHGLDSFNLFIGTPEEDSLELGPLLLRLPPEVTPALAHDLARTGALPQALSLLASSLPMPLLSQHLQASLNGVLDDGTSVLVRYYDPRIGFKACALWPEAARQQFLAPLAAWFGWNREGAPQTLAAPRGEDTPQDAWPLRVDPALAKALDKADTLDFLIADAKESAAEFGPGGEEASPWVDYLVARDALAFVAKHGPANWADKLLASRCALLTHPQFYRSKAFMGILERLPAQPGRIVAALDHVDAAIKARWQAQREEALATLHLDLAARCRQKHTRRSGQPDK